MFERALRLAIAIIVRASFIYAPLLSAQQLLTSTGDLIAPEIIEEEYQATASPGQDHEITVRVTDNIGVDKVILYYRTMGRGDYRTLPMKRIEYTDNYRARIDAEEMVTPGIEYYIKAMDYTGNALLHGHSFSPLSVRIGTAGVEPMVTEEATISQQVPVPDKKKARNDLATNFNVFAGSKHMTDPFFEEPETNSFFEYGFLFDITPGDWPVGIAIDRLNGHSLEQSLNPFGDRPISRTVETNVGLRKVWKTSPEQRVHLGGGIAYIEVESENNDIAGLLVYDDKDDGVGFWFDLCVYKTYGNHLNFGFDIRYSSAQVTLFEKDVDAGGFHGLLILGVHF